MEHPGFFERAHPVPLSALLPLIETVPGLRIADDALIEDVRPLDDAGPAHLTFLDNKKYLPLLAATRAAACLIHPALAERVPERTTAIPSKMPYRSFALALARFYPTAMSSKVSAPLPRGEGPLVHPTARLEDGVEIEPGAKIGPEAWIGQGTRIAAGAVIGYRCYIGRSGYVGPNATVIHSLIGDRVILHAGVHIGQDGFGFAMGPQGHLKVPQIGRVIIQNDVEIGAGTCIDRGALKDTTIGEGTKIDNLVQIGHNVVIGRHCVICGHAGIAGSAELGDFVVMGGGSGSIGHIKIGSGAQLAGTAHAKDDLAPGGRYGGIPAKPLRQWAREIAFLTRAAAASTEPEKQD
jgi:UDP-3-O-[3-hydroxymyristoyl] glucosamine N-acyltransferase